MKKTIFLIFIGVCINLAFFYIAGVFTEALAIFSTGSLSGVAVSYVTLWIGSLMDAAESKMKDKE